jgi:tetratricopeptide (TPR) repeat protein
VQLSRSLKFSGAIFIVVVLIGAGAYYYAIIPHHSAAPPESAQGLLDRADDLAWGNQWAAAEPLYKRAESLFVIQGRPSKALYAHVSQVPPNESVDIRNTIWTLTEDLARPAAADPETRLRILNIRGMQETNYNAAAALSTWEQVSKLALSLGHYSIATRAMGEQGIAAFLLGDTETAKKKVVRAWVLSRVEHDPAATVRYASVFGAGLVQIHRYKEALTPLDEAIRIAAANPHVAYPTIAIYAKIDALVGLHRLEEALSLANESLKLIQGTPYDAHKAQVYLSRGTIYRDGGDWEAAIADYQTSLGYSARIGNYRGVTDVGGLLASLR